jgi:hypothetical protein
VTQPTSAWRRRGLGLAGLALTVLTLALLAGCGGGGSSSTGFATTADEITSSSATVSASNPQASADAVTDSEGVTEITSAIYPNGKDTDEENASGTEPIKPCQLVRKATAESILGTHVSVTERLQGPTCVYTGSGRQVTLVVEQASIKALREGARKSTPVTVAGKTGYCVCYESTSVIVAAGGRRVLQVTGPCPAGVRFAAAALPKITG